MRVFDHVLILFSFVFGLALAHLLSRVGSLMLARRRVRFSALHAFMVVNAVVLVFVNWLALWFVHDLPIWDLFSIVACFLFALASFFFCAAAAPEVPFEGTIDLEAFYWENRRLFYGLIVLQTIAAMLTSVPLFATHRSLFWSTNIDSLPFFVPPILAIAILPAKRGSESIKSRQTRRGGITARAGSIPGTIRDWGPACRRRR